MIIDSRKIGCCAFKRHVDFQDDLREDGGNPKLRGSLYIATTGICQIGSSSLLVHPTESGSAYPKENKPVHRMSGTTGQAFTKSVDTVSIWLKSRGLLPFGPSSCTKKRISLNLVAPSFVFSHLQRCDKNWGKGPDLIDF